MRKETANGNFDRPCFVQTVYLPTLLTEVTSGGWNKPAYSVGLKCACLMSGCVHCDTRQRHYRLATCEKPGESGRTFHSVCRELLVGLLLGGERWARTFPVWKSLIPAVNLRWSMQNGTDSLEKEF